MNRRIGKRLWQVIALGLLTTLGATLTARGEELAHLNADLNPEAWPIDPFVLIDHHGNAFTRDHIKGRWTFVVFGDTHCAQRCSNTLAALARVAQRLAPTQAARTTQFLFISLDPERDTAERLRDYVVQFNAGLIGARGSPRTLAQLAQEMAAAYRPIKQPGEVTPSDAPIHLIGPNSLLRAEFFPPYDARALTAAYLRLRVGARGVSRP